MRYDTDAIRKDLLLEWDCDDFYLLRYIPVRTANPNQVTNLILDFKNNTAEAVRTIEGLLIKAFISHEQELRDKRRCRHLVSIPSHDAGGTSTSVTNVCRALEKRFSWLTYIPDALIRTDSVLKSARAGPGGRPSYFDHLVSIKYGGPKIRLQDSTIIMLDDVVTLKATSKACRTILQQATGCKQVTGVFVGRTQWK